MRTIVAALLTLIVVATAAVAWLFGGGDIVQESATGELTRITCSDPKHSKGAACAARNCEPVVGRTVPPGYVMATTSALEDSNKGEVTVEGYMMSDDPSKPRKIWRCFVKDGAIRRIEVVAADPSAQM